MSTHDSYRPERGAAYAVGSILVAVIPVILWLIMLALGGCALEPQRVSIETDHVSHLTQHEPFTDHPTNFGYDSLNLVAHWQRGRLYGEVSEGVVLENRDGDCYGALWGPREVFSARVGYTLWSRQ